MYIEVILIIKGVDMWKGKIRIDEQMTVVTGRKVRS